MKIIDCLLFIFACLSFYFPAYSFLIFCIIISFYRKLSYLNQLTLFIFIFNLFRYLIPDKSIYSDYIAYEKIPRGTDFFDISSYWAASYDYLFSLLIKIIHLINVNFFLGFLCFLTLYLVLVFNIIYKIRNNLQDAIFFLLCFSYASSFQLARYTVGATIAYFLYIWRPRGVLTFLFSSILLVQAHFYSLINYVVFRLNYKFIALSVFLVVLVFFAEMDNFFVDIFPEFGKYSKRMYDPSENLKLLLYIFFSSFIFLIKSPNIYIDALKKMVILSFIFFFLNNTLSERMLVLPFNVFLGLIYSYSINHRSRLLYFFPFSVYFYRYLLL